MPFPDKKNEKKDPEKKRKDRGEQGQSCEQWEKEQVCLSSKGEVLKPTTAEKADRQKSAERTGEARERGERGGGKLSRGGEGGGWFRDRKGWTSQKNKGEKDG